MKISEQHGKWSLLIILIMMALALFSVILDYSGITGNRGLSERGMNTLILFLIISPLTILTLYNKKYFAIYLRSVNYLISAGRDERANYKTQNLIRISLLISLFCILFSIIDWIGITTSGLDKGGRITAGLFLLFLLESLFLKYGSKTYVTIKEDQNQDHILTKLFRFKSLPVCIYFATLILVVISLFLFLKLPGNLITCFLLLFQIWLIFILFFQIIFLVFKLNNSLKINVFLSTTVFMLGVLLIELFLRYAISAYTTYLEKDGFFNYISLYETKKESDKDPNIARYYVYKPNSDYTINLTEFAYKLKTNSQGLRNKEISLIKDTNEFRIICLGDSFTEGFGTDEENCWPRILERELLKKIKNKKINVINAGTAGSDVVFEYTFLKEKLLKYSPDMVISALNTSDISDITVRGGFERYKSENVVKYKSPPSWEPIYARSFIFRHIIHDFFQFNDLFIPKRRAEAEISRSVNIINTSLTRFKELSEKQGFVFVTILHPYDFQIVDRDDTYSALSNSISGTDGLHYYNLLGYFKNDCGINNKNIYQFCWKIDKHYNSKGYDFMAKGIAKYLFDSGLLIPDNQK
jgi:lysophospholipase L1-like esterase